MCDLRDNESQTLIRYLNGLDEQIAYVMELHLSALLDEWSTFAHTVRLQKKLKPKGMVGKPNPRPYAYQTSS